MDDANDPSSYGVVGSFPAVGSPKANWFWGKGQGLGSYQGPSRPKHRVRDRWEGLAEDPIRMVFST